MHLLKSFLIKTFKSEERCNLKIIPIDRNIIATNRCPEIF